MDCQLLHDTLSTFLETIAVLIITSCVIPIVVILIFAWIIKILFGFDIKGVLPAKRENNTLEKIRQGYSKVRNRAIANAFAYMKIIEQWGSGIPRIFEEFKEYGLKEPELIDFDGDFRMNFYRIVLGTTQTIQTIQSNQLTDLDMKVIKVIIENPAITQSQIVLELGWPLNRVKYYTKKLRDKGILEHKGNSRRGTWKVHLENEQIEK